MCVSFYLFFLIFFSHSTKTNVDVEYILNSNLLSNSVLNLISNDTKQLIARMTFEKMNVKFPSISCLLFAICCCLNAVTQVESNEFCTINTKSGPIRGKINHTLFDKLPYYSFRGIPFGKPPVGNLRFKVKH